MREKLIELLMETFPNASGDRGYYSCCADELIANGVTIQQWIPVTERLPEETGKYIVCTAKGSVYCTKFYTKRFGTDSNTHITHWMPLPEPTKDGGV